MAISEIIGTRKNKYDKLAAHGPYGLIKAKTFFFGHHFESNVKYKSKFQNLEGRFQGFHGNRLKKKKRKDARRVCSQDF